MRARRSNPQPPPGSKPGAGKYAVHHRADDGRLLQGLIYAPSPSLAKVIARLIYKRVERVDPESLS